MFEFMYAKKIKRDIAMEVIDKYKDNYYLDISHKPNGTIEIFIGSNKRMTAFSMFTDDGLDAMESAFCNEGLTYLVDEIRKERRYRESRKTESEE